MPRIEIYADIVQSDGTTRRYFPYWYERDKCYKVLERSGDNSNRDENAMHVLTLEDVAEHISEGYAVRMAPPGVTDPRRIPPDRIIVKHG